MNWWHKIRRTWTSLSTRIKLRKSPTAGVAGGRGGAAGQYGGDSGGALGGLLKLRDDVQMCGYRDVEVMWNMLSISLQQPDIQPMEAARSTKTKLPRRSCNRQRSLSRLFFWTNHNPS